MLHSCYTNERPRVAPAGVQGVAVKKKAVANQLLATALNTVAEWTGLEPATPGVTGRYSNQLNYHSW
jgi:hypothetical protein